MAAAVRWRAGHARPLPGGEKGKVSGRAMAVRRQSGSSYNKTLRQHRIIPALRLKHRSGGSCRTSLAVSALRIMRCCPNKKGRCIATASFLLYSNLRMAKITWTFPRPGGPADPRHPACTARRGRGHTCRSRGGSCRGLPPTAGGRGRGGCSRQSRSHGRRAGSQ